MSNTNYQMSTNPARAALVASALNRRRRSRFERRLESYLVEDPEISDASNIGVAARRRWFHKAVHLIGTTKSERDRERAEEIVRGNVARRVELVNELEVVA